MKQCDKCGKKWEDHVNFCPMDGNRMTFEIPPDQYEEIPSEKIRIVEPESILKDLVEAHLEPLELQSEDPLNLATEEIQAMGNAPTEAYPVSLALEPEEPQDLPDEEPQAIGRFSETQWFMAALVPEELEDIDINDADVVEDRYRKEKPLDKNIRDQFSLSEHNKNKK